jgi:quercetin dioxygenase-like cupin family protein
MKYPRLFTSADGDTHFGEITVDRRPAVYVPGIPLVDIAAPTPVNALIFSRLAAGYDSDWHPPPRRQFVIVLTGTMRLTASDGEVRRFGPGAIFLVEDLTGKGHQTSALGNEEVVVVTIPLSN